jgi:hypothetical protein
MKLKIAAALALLFLTIVVGCSIKSSGTDGLDSSVSEIGVSVVSGVANSTENSGSMSLNEIKRRPSAVDFVREVFKPSDAMAAVACPTVFTGTCSGSTMDLVYDNCMFGTSTATWNGTQRLTFGGGASCTNNISTLNAGTVTRTFPVPTTRTSSLGVTVTIDTSGGSSGWSTPVSITGAAVTFSNPGPWTRTINIGGVHLTGTWGGKTLFDHTVSTGSNITVTGSGSSKQISGGSIIVQHNLAKYVGTISITSPLTYGAFCCVPTGGAVSTALSGSLSGNETMTFGPSCGQATLTNSSGTQKVSLSHCF